jgi:hypothetical protein
VAELPLADQVLVLAGALERARIPHAFGGALAFAYYGEPRATIDIDMNIFVGPDHYELVMDVLEPIGVGRAQNEAVVTRDGQIRLWWGRTPIDLFFAYDPVHGAMQRGVRMVPFATATIPILGPEHLMVAKVAFNRAKDWIDIEQMLVAVPSLDLTELHGWLDRLVGLDDERMRHLQELERELLNGR